METSFAQKKYYQKKLFLTILNYYKGTEYKFEETVNDCFRYLEKNKNCEFNNIHERKKIFVDALFECELNIQKYYINISFDNRNDFNGIRNDFYGVKNIVNNIIESYDLNMLEQIILTSKSDINIDNLEKLNTLSSHLFNELDIITINNLFKNYILPKESLSNTSKELSSNIKKILNSELDNFNFLKEDISLMNKTITLLAEKNKILSINNKISRYLSSKEKKTSNRIESSSKKIEINIFEKINKSKNKHNEFFSLYSNKLDNLKIEVLNLIFQLEEDKKLKLLEEIQYLKKPTEQNFSENKLFNFLKDKIDRIKYKQKIKNI